MKMEAKYNKLIFFFLFVFTTQLEIYAQQTKYIHDIFVDNVRMQSSQEDYRVFFKGKTIIDTTTWNEWEEINIRNVTYESDSIYIYMSSYGSVQLYTKYIEILSSRYAIKLQNSIFQVGMSIDSIQGVFFDIKKEYQKYVEENEKNFLSPAYFGEPLLIEFIGGTGYCGGLKFKIKEGKVISILIDFQMDGDLS
jgi:hypothetical protein